MIYQEETGRTLGLDLENLETVPGYGSSDLDAALYLLRLQLPKIALATSYYEGRHRLLFATEKFRNAFGGLFRNFSDNLLSVVVEILTDRMLVKGFEVEEGSPGAGDLAWEIWKQNRMDLHSCEAMREAFISGSGYVIVWPDETGRARIHTQASANVAVCHDPENPDLILWAVKVWLSSERRLRLNLYYPDRIEKYSSQAKFDSSGMLPERGSSFVPYEEEEGRWPLPNPYGVVPVFHFMNNARIGTEGQSEILPLAPLQDALNKSIVDLLVNMEFQAFPQRWATGIEPRRDPQTGEQISPFKPGVDRLWLATSSDAKFGELSQGDLNPFLNVAESFRTEIARISGIPLHYFLQAGSYPSGAALRIAETRLIKKVENRQIAFGNVWEDAMRLAVEIETGARELRLSTLWEEAAPQDTSELLQTLLQKQQIGVSARQLLLEAGYGEAEVDGMLEEKTQQAATLDDVLSRTFDRGQMPN